MSVPVFLSAQGGNLQNYFMTLSVYSARFSVLFWARFKWVQSSEKNSFESVNVFLEAYCCLSRSTVHCIPTIIPVQFTNGWIKAEFK